MRCIIEFERRLRCELVLASFIVWLVLVFALCGVSVAGPEGAQVVNGQASIQQSGLNTVITASDRAIINYSSFDIGRPEVVQFVQPGSSASVLNRILSANPTNINGTLLANGNVFFVNPAGVYIGNGARINVNQLIASGLNISNSDFIKGKYNFAGGVGSVVNEGDISAQRVYLIGRAVANSGRISCPAGYVVMAAGDRVFLGEPGGRVVVEVDVPAESAGGSANSGPAVLNEGSVEAAGGRIVLAAGDIYSQAISNVGSLSAAVDSGVGGTVAATGGEVVNSGVIDAGGSRGGEVAIEAGRLAQLGTVRADGSESDGGSVELIAGEVVALGPKSLTTANAGMDGGGGEVVVFSPETALFRDGAVIEAKGGSKSGDGGFVEVSGKEHVEVFGFVDARAAGGEAGEFLIDPYDVEIKNPNKNGDWDESGDPYIFTPNASGSQIAANKLEQQLQAASVTITTTSGDITEHGDITVTDAIDLDGGNGHTLTLQADDDIIVNAQISDTDLGSADAVNIVFSAADGNPDDGPSVDIGASINTYGGNFTSSGTTFDNTGGVIDTGGGDIAINHTGTVTLGADLNPGGGSMSETSTAIIVASNAASIQDAVDIAASGATVTVGDGEYTEDLVIGKGLDLVGEQTGVSGVDRKDGGYTETVIKGSHIITADDVDIDGFTLSDPTTDVVVGLDSSGGTISGFRLGNSVVSLVSGGVGVDFGAASLNNQAISGATIEDCAFMGPDDMGSNPIRIGGWFGTDFDVAVSDLTFQSNYVEKGSIPIQLQDEDLADISILENEFTQTDGTLYVWGKSGSSPSGELSNFEYSGNVIDSTNSYGVGIDVFDVFDNDNFGGTIEITNNSFDLDDVPTKYGFDSVSILSTGFTGSIDATENWFGTNSAAGVAAEVSDHVDYSPWWGADYAGDDHSSAWTWHTDDSIQDAINAASTGDSVTAAAGVYSENLDIDTQLGGLEFTGDGSVASEIDGTVDLMGANLSVSTENDGALTLNSVVDTGADSTLSVDTGAGALSLDESVTANGGITLSGGVVNVGNEASDKVTSGGAVSITGSGTVTVDAEVDPTSVIITVGGDASAVINNSVTADSQITISADDDVTLNAGGDLTTTSGSISVTADADNDADGSGGMISMADGAEIDAGTGTILLAADEDIAIGRLLTTNGTGSAVSITSGSGAVTDAGDTGGPDIDAGAAGAVVSISAATGIGAADAIEAGARGISGDTTGGDVRIDNTLDSDVTAGSLTTGHGDIVFNQAGGGSLTAETVSATGGDDNVTLTTANGGDITIDTVTAGNKIRILSDGSIDEVAEGPEAVDLTAAELDLDAQTGIFGASPIETASPLIAADTANGNVEISNTYASDVQVSSLTTQSGDIDFRQGVDLSPYGGNVDLAKVTTGNGDIDLVGAGEVATHEVTATLGKVTIESTGGDITVWDDIKARTLLTFKSDVVLGADVIASGANVEFEGAVDGGYGLTVISSVLTGFRGPIGSSTPLASLATDSWGRTEIGSGTISLDGASAQFNDAVLLTDNLIINEAGTGDIEFVSTVDSEAGSNYGLTVNSGSGSTIFGGAVGGDSLGLLSDNSGLGSVTTNAAGDTQIDGGAVTTTGSQSYQDEVTLGAATTDLRGSGVAFADTVDGASALTVYSSGTTGFGAAVGGQVNLTSVVTDGPGTTELGGNVTTTAAQTYNDDVVLKAGITVESTGDAGIMFGKTVEGAFGLTANTGGATHFVGDVGSVGSRLVSLETDAGGTTDIDENVTTSGGQNYYDDVTVAAGKTLSAGGDMTLGAGTTMTGEGDLQLEALGGGIVEAAGEDGKAHIAMPGGGGRLGLKQNDTIAMANFTVDNSSVTDLAAESTAGAVTALGADDNPADAWTSIDATAQTDISLGGTGDITTVTLMAGTGDIQVVTDGSLFATDKIDATAGSVDISAGTVIDLGENVEAGTNLRLRDNTVVAAGKTLLAQDNLTVDDGAKLTGQGALTVEATTGTATFGGEVETLAGDLDVTAGTLIHAKDNVTAAGSMLLHGAVTVEGGKKLKAGTNVTVDDGQKLTGKGLLGVEATAGTVTFGGEAETLAGDLNVTAGTLIHAKENVTAAGSMLLDGAVTVEGDKKLQAGTNLTMGTAKTLTAKGDLELAATGGAITEAVGDDGKVQIGLPAGGATLELSQHDSLAMSNFKISNSANADLAATSTGGSVSVLATDDNPGDAWQSIEADALTDITLKGASDIHTKTLTADTGAITIDTGGSLLGSELIEALDGSVYIMADKDIDLDKAVSAGQDMWLRADDDGSTDGSVFAGGELTAEKGFIRIRAADNTINLDENVEAGLNLELYNHTVVAAGKTLKAGQDVVVANGKNLQGQGALTVEAGRNITLGGPAQSGGTMTLTANYDENEGGDVWAKSTVKTTAGSILISAPEGTINLDDNVEAAFDLELNDGTVVAAGKTLKGVRDVAVAAGKSLLGEGALTVEAGRNITLGGATESAQTLTLTGNMAGDGGDVLAEGTVKTISGDIDAAGVNLTFEVLVDAASGFLADAGGDLLTKGVVTAAEVDAEAVNITFEQAVTAGGSVVADATGELLANSTIDATAGDVSLSADDNEQVNLDDDVSAGQDILLRSNTEVAAGRKLDAGRDVIVSDGKTLTGEGALSVEADRNITLGGAVESAGTLTLSADFEGDGVGDLLAKDTLKTTSGDIDADGVNITFEGAVEAAGNMSVDATEGIWAKDELQAAGNIELTAVEDIALSGAVSAWDEDARVGGGVGIVSETGRIYTPGAPAVTVKVGNVDQTLFAVGESLNVPITGYSDDGEQVHIGVDLPLGGAEQKAAIKLISEESLGLGAAATLTARGTYYTSLDERPGVNFEIGPEGGPIDVAILLGTTNQNNNVAVGSGYIRIDESGQGIGTLVVSAGDTVLFTEAFETSLTTAAQGPQGPGSWLKRIEVVSRSSEDIAMAFQFGTWGVERLPRAKDPQTLADGDFAKSILEGGVGGTYVLRGTRNASLLDDTTDPAYVLDLIEPMRFSVPMTMEPLDLGEVEELTDEESDKWLEEEGLKPYLARAYPDSLNTNIDLKRAVRKLRACKAALDGVTDEEMGNLVGLVRKTSQMPAVEEQMATFRQELLREKKEGVRYAELGGEWMDALVGYVEVLNSAIGYTLPMSIDTVMRTYGQKLTEVDDRDFVQAYLVYTRQETLGG